MGIRKNLVCLISGALIVLGAYALDNQRESPQENCKELCSEVLNEKGKVSFSIGKVNYYINVHTNNNPGVSTNNNLSLTNNWLDMSVIINPEEVKYYWFNFRDYECDGILNAFGMYFIDANSTNKVNCSGKIAQSMYEHRIRIAIGHLK